MHDPAEGVTAQGTITTGAARDAIDQVWLPLLGEARREIPEAASLYVYGSVATGTAVAPGSDVDLLTLDLPAREAERVSIELSTRYHRRCRAVSIAPASSEALRGKDDESYGLQVFLRHYCVHLAGDDPSADLPDYAADRRAARGFNGDIAEHRAAWLDDLRNGADLVKLGTRVARKTLLAVAGIVSIRQGTWTTDRWTAAAEWQALEPDHPVDVLAEWLDEPPTDVNQIRDALHGPVAHVERMFASEIGLWSS